MYATLNEDEQRELERTERVLDAGTIKRAVSPTDMPEAIIFDCFGVLITDALEDMVAALHASEPNKAAQVVATVTAANKGIISSEVSRETIADLFGISVDEYTRRIRNGEVKNTELLDYIVDLRRRYKTALLSNVSAAGLAVRFTPEELSKHFDVVVASGVIGYAKPEAQAYEVTAERLGVRLDACVMIDDREDYCLGAQGAGMRAIQYTSFEQMKRTLEGILR